MSEDLTRWNRAGLTRFRYVDGNAATWLEDLRAAFAKRFPDWVDLGPETPSDPDDAARNERLLDQYFEREPKSVGGRSREAVARLRQDPAWQIARALARAVHVSTEYLDAYANEGYLRTATQWENVRRLVDMLDVHPAPPASASTLLVLSAKGDPGTVEAGFQVEHTPPVGGPPIVFETLADVEVDPALNEMRLKDWNRSPTKLGELTESPWIAGEKSEITAGQLALLVMEGTPESAAVVKIGSVDAASRRIGLERESGPDPSGWTEAETRLLARPEFIERPRLNGPSVVSFDEAHDLAVGEVVAWQVDGDWTFATVRETGEREVRLAAETTVPGLGVEVFRALRVERVAYNPPPSPLLLEILLPAVYQEAAKPKEGRFAILTAEETVVATDIRIQGLRRVIDKPGDPPTTEVRYIPLGARPVGRVAEPSGELRFDGKPGKLAAGQWAIGEDDLRALTALSIDRIEERGDHYAVTFKPLPVSLVRLYALFAETLRPEGYDRNDRPLSGSSLSLLELNPALLSGGAFPPLLARGRELVVEQKDGEQLFAARRARVVEAGVLDDSNTAEKTLRILIAPAIGAADGFTLGNTIVRGNVVEAGHGEGKPEKVLGSGDATLAGQSLVLTQKGVSFVADSTQPSGVRADLAVKVEGQIWEQVATLRTSGPADPHYTARPTEEGHLMFGFGDGRAGRRLPSGTNNVRVRFRVGSGLSGNVPAGSFAKPKRPHRLVAGVRQPFAAGGGNDQEPIESLRQNAPASVLTLERAVSLADFAALAVRQASVWQARAFSLPPEGRRQGSIEVVVVPAGGGALGDLEFSLREFLVAHALPGVDIRVSSYLPSFFDLSVIVQGIKSQFDLDEVRDRVRAALLSAFRLERRRLGQDLYLSEVVQVVEGVQGVESSVSVLNGDSSVRRLPATDREVIYLDPAHAQLDVDAQEVEL